MKSEFNSNLITAVANSYYNNNLTQSEIAQRYNISRPKVSRLLAEAKENGIVKIFINNKADITSQAEDILLKKFGLQAIKVIPVPDNDSYLALQITAQESAAFFAQFLVPTDRIGISWGYTLYTLAKYFPSLSMTDCSIYQLTGSVDDTSTKSRASQIVDIMGQKLHTEKAFSLPCPAMLDNSIILDMLLHDKKLKCLLESINSCTKFIVNLASTDKNCCLYKAGYINDNDLSLLEKKGSVGSICCRFIDKNGDICDDGINNRTISLSLDTLKSCPSVFCCIANKEKVPALYASLKARYIDILAIDSVSAEALISYAE